MQYYVRALRCNGKYQRVQHHIWQSALHGEANIGRAVTEVILRIAYSVWTTQKFPFSVKTAHALKIREPHVITVTGKAFYELAMRLPIIQTGGARRRITRCGKFIR